MNKALVKAFKQGLWWCQSSQQPEAVVGQLGGKSFRPADKLIQIHSFAAEGICSLDLKHQYKRPGTAHFDSDDESDCRCRTRLRIRSGVGLWSLEW